MHGLSEVRALEDIRDMCIDAAEYYSIYSRIPVDPTGRFAAVEFHDFMHMRVKTICRF